MGKAWCHQRTNTLQAGTTVARVVAGTPRPTGAPGLPTGTHRDVSAASTFASRQLGRRPLPRHLRHDPAPALRSQHSKKCGEERRVWLESRVEK